MTRPLISVVMSVYNSEKYLSEAIESILNQTYTNFEFIIVNDGSTDSSFDIIQKYAKNDERIVLISRENKGLPFSLNEGIKKARGKYIARMDADDISLPTRFEEQVKFMENEPNVGVCGSCIKIFANGCKKKWRVPITDDECKMSLLVGSCFAHPAVMIRKSVLEDNQIFYDENLYTAQDYALWISLSGLTKFANIPKVLLHYRKLESSISSQADKRLDVKFKLLLKYIEHNLVSFDFVSVKNAKILFSLLVNKDAFKIPFSDIVFFMKKLMKKNGEFLKYDEAKLKKKMRRKLLVYLFKTKSYRFLLKALFI